MAPTGKLVQVDQRSISHNEMPFRGGSFLTPDGTLHVHGGDSPESVKINSSASGSASAITLKVDQWTMDYDAARIHEIHLRLHGGDDSLNVQPQLANNLHVYAGAGNDRILAGAGSDWLIGGAGDDFIAGRGNRDYIEGNDGDDTLLGGVDQDTLVGWGGNDKLLGGAGKDITGGGDGADILDGGHDDDLVWSGRGPDRIVNPTGADEARDAKAEDTLLTATPEELIYAELSAEDEVLAQQELAADHETSLVGMAPPEEPSPGTAYASYGYNGAAGPFWLEPAFGTITYHSEEDETPFQPFYVSREDTYGPDVDFELSYSGTATAADFPYRQTSVTASSGLASSSVEIQTYDDAALESTEDFTAWFSSAVVPNDPGMFIIVDYPSTGQPSTDPDGDPYSATGYVIDGDLTIYNGLGVPVSETYEQNPGAYLNIGELHALEVLVTPSAGDSFVLNYPSQLAAWLDGNRSQPFPSGSAITESTLLYFEAIEVATNGVVELEYNGVWYLPTVDQLAVSAGTVDLDADTDNSGSIDAADEPLELEGLGQIIGLNSDDDDVNGQSDLEQSGQVVGEGDLVQLPLLISANLPGNLSDWKATIEVQSGSEFVKLWGSSDKSVALPTNGAGEVEWPLTSSNPWVYAEGISTGTATVVLTMWNPTIDAAEYDAVRLTVAEVDLELDSNNDGAIDSTDDPIEMQQPGRIVLVNDDAGIEIVDDELVEARLSLDGLADLESLEGFSLRLDVVEGSGLVRIWNSRSKDSEIFSGVGWPIGVGGLPMSVFIEGVQTGEAVLRLTLVGPSSNDVLSDEVRVTVLQLTVDVPGEITADTQEAFVSAILSPFFEPDLASGANGVPVEFTVRKNGVEEATLSATASEGGAAVGFTTATVPGTTYTVDVTFLGATRRSDSFVIVPGAPASITTSLSKPGYVSDGTDTISITATVRDQFGNLVADGTPVAWLLLDETSHFDSGATAIVSETTNGIASAVVRAPDLPGTQEVRVVAGAATTDIAIPVATATTSLSGPNQLDLTTGAAGTVQLTTNAANGTPVYWTISNGDTHFAETLVNNGQSSLNITAAGKWARVGPAYVTATVAGRLVYHKIDFTSSDPFYLELERFVISGDVIQDGVETLHLPGAQPLPFAPQVVPNRTVDVPYYAGAELTIRGDAFKWYVVELADSVSQTHAIVNNTYSNGRVLLDGSGVATVFLESRGVFDGDPYTIDFADVTVKVTKANESDPYLAPPPGSPQRTVTAKYVEHTWWTRTKDGVTSFIGGDPQTAAGVGANVAGGMLVVGDIGALTKNAWRMTPFSDTDPNYTEASLSAAGLLTELAVGVGEAADAPISGVRSLVSALGQTKASEALVILLKRAISNAEVLPQFGRFVAKLTSSDTAFQVLKGVLTSEDIMVAAIKASDDLGDRLFAALKSVSASATFGGVEGAQQVVKVLGDSPAEVRSYFATLADIDFQDAITSLGKAIKDGLNPKMAEKLLSNGDLYTATYKREHLVRDLAAVSSATGFHKLVNLIATSNNISRKGRLYELQTAAIFAADGKQVAFVSKYVRNAEGITDIDIIADGVYYQCKSSSGAFESVPDCRKWIVKARADGATTIKYVTPDPATVSPSIRRYLDAELIDIIPVPIQ